MTPVLISVGFLACAWIYIYLAGRKVTLGQWLEPKAVKSAPYPHCGQTPETADYTGEYRCVVCKLPRKTSGFGVPG